MESMRKASGLARLIAGYLFARERWRLWTLFAVVLAAYAFNIRLAVLYNDWNGRFFNALQAVDREGIVRELLYFIGLAAAIIVLLVWAGYLKDRLRIALRRDLTEIFFRRWLSKGSAHYLLRESGEEPDNPDQRITEDVKSLVGLSVNLSVSFYDSLITIGSFSVILWQLSGPAEVFGITVPGYMFWVCILYTLFATALTHLIGRKLKTLNVEAQRREANLRAGLIERHRHADAIAGAMAEAREAGALSGKLSALVTVLISLVKRQRDLDLFTVTVGQFTHLAPIFFALPAFLAGKIQLGGLMQIRGAFSDVARSLSWFITAYDDLARLAAAWERLKRLEDGLARADESKARFARTGSGDPGIEARGSLLIPREEGQEAEIPVYLSAAPGTLTLVRGPSGIGKSTLLKALAGFSPLFKGDIRSRGRIFWIPQTPYLPKGPLLEAIAWPEWPGRVPPERIAGLLRALGLPHLEPLLATEDDWATRLSGGEQNRLMLLRGMLASPDILLLDETAGGLDENAALAAVTLLRQELPRAAVILVTHQGFLEPLADAVITLKENRHGESLRPVPKE